MRTVLRRKLLVGVAGVLGLMAVLAALVFMDLAGAGPVETGDAGVVQPPIPAAVTSAEPGIDPTGDALQEIINQENTIQTPLAVQDDPRPVLTGSGPAGSGPTEGISVSTEIIIEVRDPGGELVIRQEIK